MVNGSHRQQIRVVMDRVQDILKAQGVEISNADLQAVMWFYEKDLYQKLGSGNASAQRADYADAAKALARKREQ